MKSHKEPATKCLELVNEIETRLTLSIIFTIAMSLTQKIKTAIRNDLKTTDGFCKDCGKCLGLPEETERKDGMTYHYYECGECGLEQVESNPNMDGMY